MNTITETMMTRVRVGVLTACIALVPSTTAFAQDADIVAPRGPSGTDGYIIRGEIQRSAPVETIPEVEGDDRQLLQSLNGLVFVTSAAEVLPEGVHGVTGVQAMTGDVLATPAFQTIASRYLGQPVSLRSLKQLNRDIVAFYAEHGYPVVDVVTPEQDISSGVVQLIVFKGRLGDIRVEGNEHFSSEHIAGLFRLESGQELRTEEIEEELRWLNSNPFRRVDLVYTRGDEPGETDIVLQTQDRIPFRVYGGYEDTGNEQTGYGRILAGFNWGNAFGADHHLNYQYTGNENSTYFNAHSASYSALLPWRHNLSLFGSVVRTQARPGTLPGGGNLNLLGRSHQISLRYGIPLPQLVAGGGHELTFGYDFKRTNNNLEFGGLSVLNTVADISQFSAGYTLSRPDEYGRTTLNARLVYSPGDMVSNDNDLAYQDFDQFADSTYGYGRIEISRVQRLPRDFSLIVSATAQASDGNLLGSEQLGAGGYNSVRGFDHRAFNGDEGFLFNVELRTMPIPITGRDGTSRGVLQFLIFGDYGHVSASQVAVGDPDSWTLASVGAGMRFTYDPRLSVRLDYGYQIDTPPLPTPPTLVTGYGRGGEHRLHLGIILGF